LLSSCSVLVRFACGSVWFGFPLVFFNGWRGCGSYQSAYCEFFIGYCVSYMLSSPRLPSSITTVQWVFHHIINLVFLLSSYYSARTMGGGFFKRGNGFHGCFLLHFSIFIPLLGLFLMDRLSCCCICCDKPFFLFVFPSRQVHIYLLILFPFSCWWWPESSGLEALVWQDFFFFSFCIILSLCKL